MATTLSRSQFDQACKAYVDAHPNPNTHRSDIKCYPSGWAWSEHHVRRSEILSQLPHLTKSSVSPASAISQEQYTFP